jgi:hypothetical protein
MPADLLNDGDHWRERAHEARSLAGVLGDLITREAMQRIATEYEKLATRADRRAGKPETRVARS